jgi:peptidoglycan/LPS O-acetylase OafA/YrhL
MSESARTHRPGLDGVRGLAVVAVVAYHLELVPGGFLGVDVFFVLSGYLITGLVLAEATATGTGALSLRSFWGRRIRRLVPALVAMVVAVVGVAIALGWPADERRELAIGATATLTWWANWRQAGGTSYWASGEDPFRHAWSLSIEEQFYVLWPLAALAVVVAMRRRAPDQLPVALGAVAAIGAMASGTWLVVLAHRLDPSELSRAYVGTDTRVVAPLLGCFLACVAHRWPDAWGHGRGVRAGGLMAVVVLVAMVATVEVDAPSTYRSGLLLVAAAAAGLLVRAAAAATAEARDAVGWAATRPLARYLGTRSYALYLWSWPVQVLLAFRWPELARGVLIATTLALSLALAEASHRVVEVPMRHRRGWASSPALRRPAWGVGLAAAVGVIALAATTAVAPPRHETVESADAAEEALRPPATTSPTAGGAAPTEPGEPAPLRVMLAGDSVAWTVGYYRPTDAELPDGVASIDSRAIIGCGLLAAEGWEYPAGGDGPFVAPAAEACAAQPEAERLGLEGEPDVLVLLPGAWEWSDARSPDGTVVPAQSDEMADLVVDRLLAKVRAASDVGARTVLVQWACPGDEAAEQLRDPAYVRWINELLAVVAERAVAEGAGPVDVLAPTDEVCEGGDALGRPTAAKDEATGAEIHVISFEGGTWLWKAWLVPALRALDR